MTKLEITEKIVIVLNEKHGISKDIIAADSTFDSLGIDSLDCIGMILDLEDDLIFNVPDNEMICFKSIDSLTDCINFHLNNNSDDKSFIQVKSFPA